MRIKKRVIGHGYSDQNDSFSVETDFINWKIYLEPPSDDSDIACIKDFGRAILQAVADYDKQVNK